MAYTHLPKDLPARLRAAGLTVVELDGWYGRGRPASTGSFDPVGVLWHHTGGPSNGGLRYALWMAVTGRSDLPAPLCQIAVDEDGVIYILASGRANHAGTAKASGSVAAGDGNRLYVGVECMNNGTQGWGKRQYRAMVLLGMVLGDVLNCTVNAQRAHKETSVTGKWDPGLLDMDKFRADIAKAAKADKPKPAKKPTKNISNAIEDLTKVAKHGNPEVKAIAKEAIADLREHEVKP